MRKIAVLMALMLILSSLPVYAGSGTLVVDAGRVSKSYEAKPASAAKNPVNQYYVYQGKDKQGIFFITGTDKKDFDKSLAKFVSDYKIPKDGYHAIPEKIGVYAQHNPNEFKIDIKTETVPLPIDIFGVQPKGPLTSYTLTSGPLTIKGVQGSQGTQVTIKDVNGKEQPWTGSTGLFRYHDGKLFVADGINWIDLKPKEYQVIVNPEYKPSDGDVNLVFSKVRGTTLTKTDGSGWYVASGNTVIAYTSAGPDLGILGGGGKIRIMDTEGKTIETMDADDFRRNVDAGNFGTQGGLTSADVAKLASAASALRSNGAQLNGAVKHGDYWVAEASFLRRDVIVGVAPRYAVDDDGQLISKDGKFVVEGYDDVIIKGDYIGAPGATLDLDDSNWLASFDDDIIGNKDIELFRMQDGKIVETAAYENGKLDHRYTYEDDMVTWTQGSKTLSFPSEIVNGVRIVQRPSGVWVRIDDENQPVDPETGEHLTGDAETEAENKIEKEPNENETEEAIEDANDALTTNQPGQWDITLQYWRNQWLTKGVFGIIEGLFTAYQEYRGLGAYASLFMDKEDLAERRAKVKEKFCINAYIGDAECRAEKICEKYSDKSTGGDTIVSVVPGAAVRAVAHIEAERSDPTFFSNVSGSFAQYLYKTTFFASSEEANNIQVRFYYDGGSVDWYPEPVELDEGGSISAQGNGALIKYSMRKYDQVCLIYAKGIDTGTGGRDRTICAPMVDSGVTASGEDPEEVETEVPEVETPDDSDESIEDTEDADPDEQAPEEPTEQPGDGF